MGLTNTQKVWLREHFNGRARTDLTERKIYSHDVGDIPMMIKPLVGKAVADGVVQPKSEEELVELVKMAAEQRLPLVPRGKATSGYGGVLPIKGGLVVDFYRLRQILAVDAEGLTVTVEPGIVWENLETALNKQGLALRLYPSSAPSSTVGGWLAQGGFGYGSFEFGAFQENVVSARVVLPSDEVREFAGEELDLVSDAEGITGLISQITLRVKRLEEEVIVGARFTEARWLVAALKAVVREELPLWSISFINPTMARLKGQMPPRLEHGHPVEDNFPTCPEAYIAVFVCPASRADEAIPALQRVLAANGGEHCPQGMVEHEWDERFRIMKIKRLGPSLVPSEVLVPVENLDQALDEIESKIQQPLAIEGMILKGGMALLLGFIPHDYRDLGYNMAFALALSVIKIAKKYGGRAYATGLYFAQEADSVLGTERVQRLHQFKKQVDARGIMNPGKVLGNGLLGGVMGLAGAFEPIVRIFGNAAKSPLRERMERVGKRGVPDDVAWYAHACAQCGYCVDECDQFYGRGWESESPRGKWFFLREYMAGRTEMTQEWVNKFIACTTCEVCNVECPLDLPIEPSWLKMRGQLIHEEGRLTFPPFEIMRASLRKERNIWASYSKDRSDWVPDELQDKIKWRAEIGYFPGCTASFVESDVAEGTARLLDAAGVEFTYMGDGEACCGLPMLVSGQWDAWEEIMRHNINGMKERGVETVVTSCPACWLAWTHYYPQWAEKLGIEYHFESRHYSEILAERIESGDLKFSHEVPMKITWHDSCHMGRAGGSEGIYEPPRQLLQALPGVEFVEMEHNREHAHCCGGVLSLLENPGTAKIIGDVRMQEAVDTGAEAVIASCPCCEVQLRVTAQKTNNELPIIDLAHLAAEGLGIKLSDPTDYAMEMWATFEAMIYLMKPEPMADLMVELFPPMVDAMPLGMGGMMRAIGKLGPVGGVMLKAMKPMFPILFPLLMPAMMPKVMPDMLAAVEKRVPMPQHMKEQMPDLMPAAMDNLMPKMLPMIVPLISDRLIEYLRQ